MPDDEGLVRELLLRWARAKLREPVEEQWWCGRCRALRGWAELEIPRPADGQAADGRAGGGDGATCRACGAPVEDLPF